jgi:hypothetical protein
MRDRTWTPFTIIRWVIIFALVWPAAIPLLIKDWRIKRGRAQRTPVDGGIAMLMIFWSIPFTLMLYVGLAIWWVYFHQS